MGLLRIANDIATSAEGSILVVDPDPVARHNTIAFLGEHDMPASGASNRQDLLRALSGREPELIILHVARKQDAALELVREIRGRSTVPLFIVGSDSHDDVDRIIGLESGADDYLTQPFSLRELLARVRSTLRRRALNRLSPPRQGDRRYFFAGWLFDERMHQLRNPSGLLVPLTKSELNLLGAFVNAPRRAVTREHLLQATRVHEDACDRSIDVQVLRLRRKLEQDKRVPQLIRTCRGVGYVFDTDVKLLLPGDGAPGRPSRRLESA
jgi:two-component system, OmpR family, response regulator